MFKQSILLIWVMPYHEIFSNFGLGFVSTLSSSDHQFSDHEKQSRVKKNDK